MGERRYLWPFEPFDVQGSTMYVDRELPAAAVVRDGVRTFITWPEAMVPSHAFQAEIYPTPDGAWVVYGNGAVQTTAAYVTPDGLRLSLDLEGRHALGSDRWGLWAAQDQRTHPSEYGYLGGELPEGWVRDHEIVRFDLDGGTTAVIVDRPVSSVEPAGDGIRVTFSPSPPLATATVGGGRMFRYVLESVDLPTAANGVRYSVDDFERSLVTNDATELSIQQIRALITSARSIERIPIPEHVDPSWPLETLNEQQIADLVERARTEFQDFVDSALTHDHGIARLSSLTSNAEVSIECDWPETILAVYFDSELHGVRFRYVVKLFRLGGRPCYPDDATVSFEEDLFTRAIPHPIHVVDGIADF